MIQLLADALTVVGLLMIYAAAATVVSVAGVALLMKVGWWRG